MMQQIKTLHKYFNLTLDDVKFTNKEKQFRIICMLEELQEYANSKTCEEELDSLIDCLVFLLGTIYRNGYDNVMYQAFLRIMDSNFKKEVGGNKKRDNFQLDLVKPIDWSPPNLTDLVHNKTPIILKEGQNELRQYLKK